MIVDLRTAFDIEAAPYKIPGARLIDPEELRHPHQARREGRLVGIGIGTTLDSGTNNFGQAQIVNPL